MKDKTALIFGVNGQDGTFLSKLLLDKNYKVYGVKRRTSTNGLSRLKRFHILDNPNFQLIEGDISDPHSVYQIFNDIDWQEEGEVYNLAAQSFVGASFNQPKYTFDVNFGGCLNCLETIKNGFSFLKYYFAATSEMWGNSCDEDGYQRETTTFNPCSPYAISKLAAYHLVQNYRIAYNLWCCSGVLHNHESEIRGEEFVTRKITKYVAKLAHYKASFSGLEDAFTDKHFPKLKLGNINSYRDFGYSGDYVQAMWLMLQQEQPDDYVIATGETTQVKHFLEKAFECINIHDYIKYVEIDEAFFRPSELHYLRGDATKAKNKLGWKPSVHVDELVKIMVEADLEQERLQRPTICEVAESVL